MNIHFNQQWKKRVFAFASDLAVTLLSLVGALWLSSRPMLDSAVDITFVIVVFIQCVNYLIFGLYRGVWRFASIPDLIRILRAVFVGTLMNGVYLQLLGLYFPLKTYIIYALLLILGLAGTRFVLRWFRDYPWYLGKGKRILVVGAGSAGETLMRDLYRSALIHQYFPVAFVDDDPMKQGCEVHGIRIQGTCSDIVKLVKKFRIALVMIAIPSASGRRMREIVKYCEEAKVAFRALPSLKNIADGVVKISSLREISLEDLLGREPVNHDNLAIQKVIHQKTVLVTGGGGSIGSELCRQICALKPTELIIVDSSEFNLYSIHHELQQKMLATTIHAYLCNVTDKLEIEKIFHLHKPNLVFHVAAYKHVPLLETHVRVAMYNNILGTKMVAELSDKYAVENFVLISTDKAVNPSNVMGATKRAAEVFCQNYNLQSATRFITVRFGNVLDSAGSVIPLFRKQLAQGGPLTVTHPDICRYFMTIPEAAQLILQAITMQNQGEIFVLDMGEPINILYLAEQMIKLSGKIVGQDIEIKYTGLRPGEKLFEELFHENEPINPTTHPKIKLARIRKVSWVNLMALMNKIELACKAHDELKLLQLLCQLVPEYKAKEHKPHRHLAQPSEHSVRSPSSSGSSYIKTGANQFND